MIFVFTAIAAFFTVFFLLVGKMNNDVTLPGLARVFPRLARLFPFAD
jgi:hypothetical protein